jgi:hypothetical protein
MCGPFFMDTNHIVLLSETQTAAMNNTYSEVLQDRMFTVKQQRPTQQSPWQTIFIVCGDWLPHLTVAWFHRLTLHNQILLLCRHPMLVLEFEPPTPPITKAQARTHSALEPLPCLLDPPVCPIQSSDSTNHEWVSLTFPDRVYTACLVLGPGLVPMGGTPRRKDSTGQATNRRSK